MLYSKAMIDLIHEARKRVPAEVKPMIKLANPDLLEEFYNVYQESDDTILKLIISDLFELAGEPWTGILIEDDRPNEVESRGLMKFFENSLQSKVIPGRGKTKQRIYRGQLITE